MRQRFGALNILANNAGIALRKFFEQISDEEWERVWGANLRSAILCMRSALPLLRREPHGKVINLASVEAFRHTAKLAAYATSKGALAALSLPRTRFT